MLELAQMGNELMVTRKEHEILYLNSEIENIKADLTPLQRQLREDEEQLGANVTDDYKLMKREEDVLLTELRRREERVDALLPELRRHRDELRPAFSHDLGVARVGIEDLEEFCRDPPEPSQSQQER